MRGFRWLDGHKPTPPVGDSDWCLRDAVCRLFGWPAGSEDWAAFIPGPTLADALRLTGHLGLALLPPEQAPAAAGLAFYRYPRYGSDFHCAWEPDLRHPSPLPGTQQTLGATLFFVAADPGRMPEDLP